MRQSTRISFAQERAAAARGDELVGVVAAQHQQAEGAAYVVQGAPHGREQVARLAVAAVVVEESDELREGLGVGVAMARQRVPTIAVLTVRRAPR